MEKRCPNCGLINPDSFKKCDCGYLLEPNQSGRSGMFQISSPKKSTSTRDKAIAICVVCLILIDIVAFSVSHLYDCFYSSKSNPLGFFLFIFFLSYTIRLCLLYLFNYGNLIQCVKVSIIWYSISLFIIASLVFLLQAINKGIWYSIYNSLFDIPSFVFGVLFWQGVMLVIFPLSIIYEKLILMLIIGRTSKVNTWRVAAYAIMIDIIARVPLCSVVS